jgi:hypothetical protein
MNILGTTKFGLDITPQFFGSPESEQYEKHQVGKHGV